MLPCPTGFVSSAGDSDSKSYQCANSYNDLSSCEKEAEKYVALDRKVQWKL